MISEYTADECTAPCQRTCPAGINIPGYIQAIANNDPAEAVRVMKEKNPMLSVCGRICPAPCEFECRRNLVDQPIAINQLKKFAMDYEMETGERVEVFKAKPTGKAVAVVGGGTQGLTAAYYLARLGHEPEIFETMPKLGGILRYVISKDRIPDKVLDWEIQGILDTGVKAQTGKRVGEDYTLESLFMQGKDAVLFTSGGMDSRKMVKGAGAREQTIPGLMLMLDLLSAAARNLKPKMGKRVCIIGGEGNALKAAGLCRELGAEEVSIISSSAVARGKPEENILAFASSIPVKMVGKGNEILSLDVQNTAANEISRIEADTVIINSGRLPELVFEPVKEDEKVTGWQTVGTFMAFSENRREGLFSIVEPGRISDYTAVVKAVGAGRKIAGIIHRHLMNEELAPPNRPVTEYKNIQNVHAIDDLEAIPRNLPENLAGQKQEVRNVPVNDLGFSRETAVKEASRCLNCGLICYTRVRSIT
jgi:NADPH-dependent glutamate synthase beta subunit-like oxidoreductase